MFVRTGLPVPNANVDVFNPLFSLLSDQFVNLTGLLNNSTCGNLDFELNGTPHGADDCTFLHNYTSIDYVCGCPGTSKDCFICRNGSPFAYPDLLIADLNVTCGDFENLLAFFNTQSCASFASVYSFDFIASFCG